MRIGPHFQVWGDITGVIIQVSLVCSYKYIHSWQEHNPPETSSRKLMWTPLIVCLEYILHAFLMIVGLLKMRLTWNRTKKKFWWNLFIIMGKYGKIKFKNRGSRCNFLSSRCQKIKNITKFEQMRLFLIAFLVSFFMAFLTQKLIYTIKIWFTLRLACFLNKIMC